jgi:SAM-dependent methyltransferase
MRWQQRPVRWSDPGFRQLFDGLGGHPSTERAEEEAACLLRLLQLEPGAHTLDAGCGYGRHASAIVGAGMRATAIDAAPEYAREASAAGVSVAIADLTALPFSSGAFDAVFALRFAADLLAPASAARVLAEFARVVQPGGRILISTWNTRAIDQPRTWRREGGTFVLNEKAFDAARSIYREVEYHIDPQEGIVREWVQETRRYSVEEWRALAGDAGLSIADVYGGLDAQAPENSADLVVVATRAPSPT